MFTRKLLCAASVLIAALTTVNCNKNSGPNPASVNLAPPDQYTQPNQYAAPAAPAVEQSGETQSPNNYEGTSGPLAVAPQPPPPLAVYSQPECPGENYIWTPGYWAYSDAGYYWVPGAWVLAPYAGALWTPPYWAFYDGRYRWHRGYWSHHIGFYGGINYGFGYTGLGFWGGYWNGPDFVYNREVTNVNPGLVHYVYSHSVTNYTPANHISFNGPGGIARQPVPAELAVNREARMAPLPVQTEHLRQFAGDRAQFAGVNRGRPAVTALARPLNGPSAEERPGAPMAAHGAPAEKPGPAARPQEMGAPREMPQRQEPRVAQQGRPIAPAQGMPGPRPEARRGPGAPPAAQPHLEPHAAPREAPQREQPHAARQARPAGRGPGAPSGGRGEAQRVAPEARPAPPQHSQPHAAPGPRRRPEPQAHPAPGARGPGPNREDHGRHG